MRSEVAPRRRTAGAVVLIVVLAVAGALTFLVWNHGRGEGWWGTSDSLQARLDDPLAATDLLGMRLLDSDRTGHVGLFEKAETPFVSHWFTPPSQDHEQVFDDVMSYARSQGWTPSADTATDTSRTAHKETDQGWAMTLILSFDPPDPDHPARDDALRVTVS